MASSLNKGIDAAKSGLMEEALGYFKDAIVEEPENADVWVWLSAIIEDEEKQTVFLKKALELDPGNRPAQRGMAFIERKKYIPPKPGEKLSDYTHPVGIFKNNPLSPAEAAAHIANENPRPVNQTIPEKTQEPQPQVQTVESQSAKKRKPWLDILLYGLTLMIFIIIGILIGSTLLNIDIPFLSKPPQVLSVLPAEEGVFLFENEQFTLLRMEQSQPEDLEGLPISKNKQAEIVMNFPLVTVDERLELRNLDGQSIAYNAIPAENNMHLLIPDTELSAGSYCYVFALNSSNEQSLYWCLTISE